MYSPSFRSVVLTMPPRRPKREWIESDVSDHGAYTTAEEVSGVARSMSGAASRQLRPSPVTGNSGGGTLI